MTSEGIYIGLAGNVKQIWHELPHEAGRSLYTLGVFLQLVNDYFDDKERNELNAMAKRMKSSFDSGHHSGGSAMVAQQMLIAIMGANAVDEITRKYILTEDQP